MSLDPPAVDPGRILRLQKYHRPDQVRSVVRETAQRMAALAETLVRPQAWTWRGSVRSIEAPGRVLLGDGIAFQSRTMAHRLRAAPEVVVVLLTIGPALEMRVRRMLAEGQPAEGVLLDAAGQVALHALTAALRRRLAQDAARRGFRLTARMAPGFADWALDQQRILFSTLADAHPSVLLTESCMMRPEKSISGLYGLVPRGAA